jgi:hypothetical protein
MTGGYDEHRDCENLRLLDPGGMASRLTCAKTKFDPSNPQKYDYDPIWVIPRTFVGGAPDLAMIRNDRDLVPGDDTQPAFTARLATNLDRCVTVKATDIAHICLMNNKQVLMAIQAILCPDQAEMKLPEPSRQPEPVSDQDVLDFLTWMTTHWLNIRDLTSFEALVDEKKLTQTFNLAGIAQRFLADMMRGVGPERPDA